jgi:putative transposase
VNEIVPAADRFGFFDPKQEYTVTFGKLPHWQQVGATYFITFRTADSLPQSVLDLWTKKRSDWLARRGIDPNSAGWGKAFSRLPHRIQRAFSREFSTQLERNLDELHGACLLRRPEIGAIVAKSLLHFDGSRYHLGGLS